MAVKDRRMEFRATEEQRVLLSCASEAEGSSVSDFVLRHSTQAAQNVLADRRIFFIPPERYDQFVELLDQPEQESKSLRVLFESPSVIPDV